ncbi:hypothetical protein BD779DRAFT_1472931 [Infundibulicybe gibba]|nr:hypothetical protein BD779DRAFT_1472931 [Infundibulicybe gibba]
MTLFANRHSKPAPSTVTLQSPVRIHLLHDAFRAAANLRKYSKNITDPDSLMVCWALRIPCSQTGPSPPLCTSLPDSLQRYSADPSASILVGRSKHTPLAIARKDTNGTLEVLSSNPLLTCKMRGRKLCNSSTSPMASAWLIWTHQWWCIREHDEPLQLRRVACGTAYSSHAPPPRARPGDEQHKNGMFACTIAWGKISNANDVETG